MGDGFSGASPAEMGLTTKDLGVKTVDAQNGVQVRPNPQVEIDSLQKSNNILKINLLKRLVVQYEKLKNSLTPDREFDVPDYEEEGFDPTEGINQTLGELIEVGGPTKHYDSLDIRLDGLNRPVTITNIQPGNRVQRIENAARLTYRNNSLGTIFASGLPRDVRPGFLLEASRVIEPGGFLVYQSGSGRDIVLAAKLGFVPKIIDKVDWQTYGLGYPPFPRNTYNFVLQKPPMPAPTVTRAK